MASELVDETVARIVRRGVERGELRAGTDPVEVATVLVAALEGAIMLARLQGSPEPMRITSDHLVRWIGTLVTR